jgi:hypothetical protein
VPEAQARLLQRQKERLDTAPPETIEQERNNFSKVCWGIWKDLKQSPTVEYDESLRRERDKKARQDRRRMQQQEGGFSVVIRSSKSRESERAGSKEGSAGGDAEKDDTGEQPRKRRRISTIIGEGPQAKAKAGTNRGRSL